MAVDFVTLKVLKEVLLNIQIFLDVNATSWTAWHSWWRHYSNTAVWNISSYLSFHNA